MVIYIAGPYTAPTDAAREGNAQIAAMMGLAVYMKGHTPVIPHMSHYLEKFWLQGGVDIGWKGWMAYDDEILQRCEGFYRYAHSKGADIEYARAVELKKVIFETLDDIPVIGRANGRQDT